MKLLAAATAALVLASACGDNPRGPRVSRPAPGAAREKREFPLDRLETANLDVNGRIIRAWIMNSEGKIREGMMWLTDKDVADDQGMLFVFPEAARQDFWMRNTLIPLDIVFLDANGKLLNVRQGKPLDEKTHLSSKGPAKYVLELKAGTAAKLDAKPGLIIDIPSFARPRF